MVMLIKKCVLIEMIVYRCINGKLKNKVVEDIIEDIVEVIIELLLFYVSIELALKHHLDMVTWV